MLLSFLQSPIPKRNECCSHCLKTIEPGKEYYSFLINLQTEPSPQRQDFCYECWLLGGVLGGPSSVYWRSKALSNKKEKATPEDKEERALALLKEALKQEDHEESFVLALFLARRRWLYLRQQIKQNSGQIIYLYEVSKTEEMLMVPKVSFSQIDVKTIQDKIAQKMLVA